MKLKRNKKFIIYLSISFIILIVLFLIDFNLKNELVLSSNFQSDNHYFTVLKPTARIIDGEIIAEPIYFDVKVPSAYDNVKINLNYKNEFNNNISIGLIDTNGNPYLKSIDSDAEFDLWTANKYRFVISIPQINKDKPVIINNVKLTFHKDNLNILKYMYLWIKRFTK